MFTKFSDSIATDYYEGCTTLCVCDADDNCFESPIGGFPMVQLYSYCGADGCHMRAINFERLVNNKTGAANVFEDHFENDQFKPIDDPSFLKVNRLSCSKCPIERTCPTVTLIPSTPPFEACVQPENTAPFHVTADSYDLFYKEAVNASGSLYSQTLSFLHKFF